MPRWIGGTEVYSALELIREFGTRLSDVKCSCCHEWTLYAIRYPDERGTAYLCSRCDCEQ